METKVPLSHSLWSPHDTVKDVAESLGINIPEDAAKNLAMDVEYRIHEILETAVKSMRHSKRKVLTTTDINNALKGLNIEPLYGYDNFQPLQYREALVGVSGQTLYYVDDHEVELEKLINQPLPAVPRQTTFTAHWLAIEGVQPLTPQNPLPADIKSIPPIVRGATSSMLDNSLLSSAQDTDAKSGNTVNSAGSDITDNITLEKDSGVKPLVKHVLSKELKLYFDKVVEVLLSTEPDNEYLKNAALTSLKNDPGLHQLVPYFIQFVAEQITNNLRNIDTLSTMLEVILALIDNKTIFLDPYVHALMPCVLTLLLAKSIGPSLKEKSEKEELEILKNQLAIREFAAILLKHITSVYGSSYSTLRSRVTRTLLRALLDSSKPVGTHYGALLGLQNLGPEVVKLVVLGNLKMWCTLVIDKGEKKPLEKETLLNAILDILRILKVEKVIEADSNSMDVDKTVNDELKDKIRSRFGDTVTDLIMKQDDAYDIIHGMLFGEIN